MQKIDAMGLSCPIPVVMAKKALKEISGAGEIIIFVDNATSTENLTKLANSLKCEITVNKISDNEYEVKIKKTGDFSDTSVLNEGDTVVVISSDKMGEGAESFGKNLLKAFIYALTESDTVPAKIIFYNNGAKLTAEGSPVLSDLKKLASRGVLMMTCGACINFYDLPERPAVGEVSNMYAIVDVMNEARKIIKP